jgi:hypothetical protein
VTLKDKTEVRKPGPWGVGVGGTALERKVLERVDIAWTWGQVEVRGELGEPEFRVILRGVVLWCVWWEGGLDDVWVG